MVSAAEPEVSCQSTATCTTTAIAAASLRSPEGLLSGATAIEDTAAQDATEADTGADPWRSPGDVAPIDAVPAATAATAAADLLPAANNHPHDGCYHGLEECFKGDSRFGCMWLHPFGDTIQGLGPGCQQFTTTRASV
ncbi:Hypothetical predicted protein [Marmota monax]|uniref:Uncharacterized protein n=1 Tax=Marmota monax TaxID=9995 RepID=A0A5E4AEZ8_MARMO|nr:Hypothetical predicted protein [Marmota monax]